MSLDQAIRECVIRDRIKRTKHEYCRCIDEHDVRGFADLFTEDAVVDFATREPYHGRDEIRGFLETHGDEADPMGHLATNPLIDVENERRATGRWCYLVFLGREQGTELGHGVYHETYRRDGSRWRISSLRTERRVTHTLRSDLAEE